MSQANENQLTTAHLADVSPYGVVMAPSIASAWEGGRASGPAFTVRTPPGDNASLHEAIGAAAHGQVMVVDGGGYLERALWGAIMSEAAQLAGVAGLVIDGAVRDVAETRQIGFPIFAAGKTPAGPYNKVRGDMGIPVVCGGVTVNPGDWIHADDDGVVVIPAADTDEIVALARRRHQLEEEILTGLRAGNPLSSLLGILRKDKEPTTT